LVPGVVDLAVVVGFGGWKVVDGCEAVAMRGG